MIDFDPPDPYLLELAAAINKKARSGRVLFIAKQGDCSVIFQHGSKRAVVPLGMRPSEEDITGIVEALETWSGFREDVPQYSTEIPPLPESGW